jgi:hypothetical protein
MDLVLIRPLLVAAKASDALAALEQLDRANAVAAAIAAAGNDAHQAPNVARRRHHDLVSVDVAAGLEPDDARLWADVAAADAALKRAQARHAAAYDGIGRARHAAEAAVAASWPAVLPWLAANHTDQPTSAWRALYKAIRWPPLTVTPASDHGDVFQRYTRWWPLIADPDSYGRHHQQRVAWDAFAWAELAAKRYTVTDGAVSFDRPWRPTGPKPALSPAVFLDAHGEPTSPPGGTGQSETVLLDGVRG